jgi:hypothetical protein
MKELPADASLRKRIWERLPGQLINLDGFFLCPRLHPFPPIEYVGHRLRLPLPNAY